eukprot:scaffold32351_cov60-Attheya_sp.AAC.6
MDEDDDMMSTSSSMRDDEGDSAEEDEEELMNVSQPPLTRLEEESSASLYETLAHFRLTRKGKIFKTVREEYRRDDLGFGSFVPPVLAQKRHQNVVTLLGKPTTISTPMQLEELLISQQGRKTFLVVCDTNILLHNLDLLEHVVTSSKQQESSVVPMANLVIPQTALMECRKHSLSCYNRTMDLIRSNTATLSSKNTSSNERLVIFFPDVHHMDTQYNKKTATTTPNDVNDGRIRKVALYFGSQLDPKTVKVVLLTDDVACRQLARDEQGSEHSYTPQSVREHVQQLQKDDSTLSLMDLVAHRQVDTKKEDQALFETHVNADDLSRGVKTGEYLQGVLRCDRNANQTASVVIRRANDRVAITLQGYEHMNRAVDGDIVAIKLLPLSQWLKMDETDASATRGGTASGEATTKTGIAPDTADPTLADIDNVAESLAMDDESVQQRPTGKVVGIIRRNFRQNYCGSIYSASSKKSGGRVAPSERDQIAAQYEVEHTDGADSSTTTTCVFFAMDSQIPPILVRTTQRARLLGKRILVAIDSWPIHSRYPLGHYVRTLGNAGEKDVETLVLLHEHNIPCDPFPPKVLACLPSADYKIELEPGRVDLRGLPVLSIDPPGCKDIDDALHCTVLPNGNYQVGVHIADVTHYVKAGTAIDLEAANRSTSTYLVNKRLDMLPSLLTTDLCSLKGNVDRFAFSVLWEVTPEADIVKVDFKKTVIHSIAALTYQQAQGLIDQPEGDGNNEIQAGAVKRLASLARKFRARRIAAGALTLASPEVKFVLDSESLNPTDVQAYALFEANALVEEFMLLANVTVSKKILRHYPTLSILRRHPAPNRAMFEGLISKAKACRGFDIDIDDSKRLADSLDAAVIESDPYFNKLLRILSTRCMSPAQYFCSGEYRPTDWHHYGLAAPVYTHFTSPIRRYADVCVHRLLAAAIGDAPLPVHLSSKSYLHDLAANMNRRHRAAQLAGRASVQLHTLLFFSSDDAKEEDAYVLDVDTTTPSASSVGQIDPSFTVMVPRYGIEGRVRLTGLDEKTLRREPDHHRICYMDGETQLASIQVFDKVRVKIFVREEQENQKELVLELVEPKQFGAKDISTIASSDSKRGRDVDTSGNIVSEATPTGSASKKKRKSKKR